MPTPRLSPVEEYVRSVRKMGFSRDQVVAKLKEKGYSPDVIDLADKGYHAHRVIMVLAVLLVVSILTNIVFMYRVPTPPPAPGTPEAFSQGFNPIACQSIQDADQRKSCLDEVTENLQDAIKNDVSPADPRYNEMISNRVMLAALKDDPSICQGLSGSDPKQCLIGMRFSQAVFSEDSTKCEQIDDAQGKEACVMAVLQKSEPQKFQEQQELVAKTMSDAILSLDPSKCASIPVKSAQDACKLNIAMETVIRKGDVKGCDSFSNPMERTGCVQQITMRAQVAK